jgi:hypothetical protein
LTPTTPLRDVHRFKQRADQHQKEEGGGEGEQHRSSRSNRRSSKEEEDQEEEQEEEQEQEQKQGGELERAADEALEECGTTIAGVESRRVMV